MPIRNVGAQIASSFAFGADALWSYLRWCRYWLYLLCLLIRLSLAIHACHYTRVERLRNTLVVLCLLRQRLGGRRWCLDDELLARVACQGRSEARFACRAGGYVS